ncbi:MAG: Hsp20/alpha crystallin family protein [Gemmatimonadales bacterium]|nr:Hsp20/alpha crystallin family protein [Gemmatimonadales bacterium]
MPLVRQDPATPTIARDAVRMRNRLQRFFEEPFGFDLPMPLLDERRIERLVWTPAVEATETAAEYVITAELPGISQEDVEVAMSDGMLTLRGSKLEERKEGGAKDKKGKDAESLPERTYHLWERTYGEFERNFRFPADVNEAKVTAEFANGILTVRVPKMEIEAPKVRTVPIAKK